MLVAPALLLLTAAATAAGSDGRLLGIVRNLTDQRSSLVSIDAGGGNLAPKANDVPGLGFIQALQVIDRGRGRAGFSYSIATDPNASGPANTVLSTVDVATGSLVSALPLPFAHVSMLAEGMFLHYEPATGDLLAVGRMDSPPPSLPHATAGDHIIFRVNPDTRAMAALGSFGGDDPIANVGAFDPATGILWAQCVYDDGRAYVEPRAGWD